MRAERTASDSGLQECLENRLFIMVERSTISRATSCETGNASQDRGDRTSDNKSFYSGINK